VVGGEREAAVVSVNSRGHERSPFKICRDLNASPTRSYSVQLGGVQGCSATAPG
jgi:hypothetical protein